MRQIEPDLVISNRAGLPADYDTPEQRIGFVQNTRPWETCATVGTQWSYKPDDRYKSPRQLIQLLVDIAAKGGNLLLNIGPRPDGTLPPEAVKHLEEIGRWMAVNGAAIHGTRPMPPYKQGRVAFTAVGHTLRALWQPEHYKLMQNAVRWLLRLS